MISLGPCSPRHVDTPSGVGFHRQRHGAAKLSGRESCGGALLLAGCDGFDTSSLRRSYAHTARQPAMPIARGVRVGTCPWSTCHVGQKQGQRSVAASSTTSPLQPERKWYSTANVSVPIWAGLVEATESLFVSTRWNGMPAGVREVCLVLALHVCTFSDQRSLLVDFYNTHLRLGGRREKKYHTISYYSN